MVCTNRCGFSYHRFQEGGTCIIASDGSVVAQANEKGEEEMIFAQFADLRVSPRRTKTVKDAKKVDRTQTSSRRSKGRS
jgi:ribosomal protein L24E